MFTEATTRILDRFAHPHGIEPYLGLVSPLLSTSATKARIVSVEQVGAETDAQSVVIGLRPNRHWKGFVAGQFTQVGVEVDGRRHTRCYSPTSSTNDTSEIELIVRRHDGGVVSTHLAEDAQVGDIVHLSAARGEFVLDHSTSDPIVFISGGSGITPVLAMFRSLVDAADQRDVTFIHYNHSPASHPAEAELTRLAEAHPHARLVTVYSDQPDAGDLTGRFDAEQLASAAPAWADSQTYACGPATLLGAISDHFVDSGRAERLHTESFTLDHVTTEVDSVAGNVRFAGSDTQVSHEGETLLQLAQAAGLDPAHGCGVGVCHTCTRSLVCGTVRNTVDQTTTTGPDTPVRICVHEPVGDVVVDL